MDTKRTDAFDWEKVLIGGWFSPQLAEDAAYDARRTFYRDTKTTFEIVLRRIAALEAAQPPAPAPAPTPTGTLDQIIAEAEDTWNVTDDAATTANRMSLTLKSIAAQARDLKTAPAPTPETVTISKAAFDEAIKVLTLVLGNLDDEPYATTNRLIHAIGVLKGDINPLPF